MMHFMTPADRPYISAVAPGKPFEPLVDDHIMHDKIGEPIYHDTKSYGLHPPGMIKSSEVDQQYTWYSEDHKESIVLFKKSWFCPVMVFVQVPQKTMHHKFMGAPGHSFHYN